MACNGCPSHAARKHQPVSVWTPLTTSVEPSLSLINWFDDHLSRIQEDLVQNNFFEVPQVGRLVLDPQRKSRLFDALFSDTGGDLQQIKFHENPNRNQVECHLNTGCGDFFRPEDIEVNVKDRNVEFKAKREHKSDDGNSYSVREVRRVFSVPENADVEKLHAEIAPNGRLLLTAPLVKPTAVEEKPKKPVPIKINRH